MKKAVYFCALATLGFSLAITASPAMASLLYTTSFFTDPERTVNGVEFLNASASASFSINGLGQLVVVLSDTTVNPYEDSQNLSAISFSLHNFGNSTHLTGTLVSISGDSISSTPLSTDVSGLITSGGASLVNTPWTNTDSHADGSLTASGQIRYFANVGTAGGGEIAQYSIVAPASGSPLEYRLPTPNCTTLGGGSPCGTSQEFGSNGNDSPMIYGSATFVFTIAGLGGSLADFGTAGACTAGKTCIDNVIFGFGPDGPDRSDISDGSFQGFIDPLPPAAVPEPSTTLLFGAGLFALVLGVRGRRKSLAAA